jgi:putative MATE family efflux protein
MNKNTTRLGEEKILNLLIRFTIPAMVGSMVTSFYTIIDRIFVGRYVGSDAFAGIGVTFAISMVLMSFGMLIGIGTSARISIALGRKKPDEAEKILGNALFLILVAAAVLTTAGLISLDPLLDLLGASTVTKPYAKQFIGIILLGSLFQFIGFGLNGVISSQGHPKTSMLTMILNASVNVLLLVLFIRVFHWGVAGSAFATLIAQGVSAVWVFSHLRSRKRVVRIRFKNIRPEWTVVRSILLIGFAPFLMQMSGSIVMAVLNRQLVSYGGDMALGAMNAIFGLAIFLVMPVIGISQGAQPIIGYNYGAKQYRRVKKTLGAAIAGATIYSCAVFTLIQIFPSYAIRLFTSDSSIVSIGTGGIRVYLLMLPVVGLQIIGANFFLSIGKPVKSMMLNLLRQVIILIPLLFILPRFLGIFGIWVSIPASDFISSFLTAAFVLRELGHLSAAQSAQDMTRASLAKQECYPESESSEYVL